MFVMENKISGSGCIVLKGKKHFMKTMLQEKKKRKKILTENVKSTGDRRKRKRTYQYLAVKCQSRATLACLRPANFRPAHVSEIKTSQSGSRANFAPKIAG